MIDCGQKQRILDFPLSVPKSIGHKGKRKEQTHKKKRHRHSLDDAQIGSLNSLVFTVFHACVFTKHCKYQCF